MKKIIATVLAMVMALALCTTAFAAGSTTTEVASKGWTLMDMENNVITIAGDKFTKTVKSNDVIDDVTYYYADSYKIDTTTYYACDDTIATNKLFKGNEIVYLTANAALAERISAVVDKTVAAVKNAGCGEYDKEDGTLVLVIDNEAFWADKDGGAYAMLKGKVVAYDPTGADAVPHDFDDEDVTTDTKGTPVAVTCDVCKKSFKLVETVPANYTGTVDTFNTDNDEYFVLLDSTTATTTDGTATSPKTFDAGIAMYVGMALTSVAGSAVVIGKKKEF